MPAITTAGYASAARFIKHAHRNATGYSFADTNARCRARISASRVSCPARTSAFTQSVRKNAPSRVSHAESHANTNVSIINAQSYAANDAIDHLVIRDVRKEFALVVINV
jgi:hypothetical protein